MGISFHDHAEVLEQILTDYPEIEVVQIQFNYVDYDDPAVQSRKWVKGSADREALIGIYDRLLPISKGRCAERATWPTRRSSG